MRRVYRAVDRIGCIAVTCALLLAPVGCGGGQGEAPPLPPPGVHGCSGDFPFAVPPVERTDFTHFNRRITPFGRLVDTGVFPTGGALAPGGRYYWAVDAGVGTNDIWIIDLENVAVLQRLPMPGGSGSVVFSPDGTRAYASGQILRGRPAEEVRAPEGDAVHVFAVDPDTGLAAELDPIHLPSSANPIVAVGSSRRFHSFFAGGGGNLSFTEWPAGLDITPDGKTLVVALYNADLAAVIDLDAGDVRTLPVGRYPYDAKVERTGRFAYVPSELEGTLTKIDLDAGQVVGSFPLGLSEEHIGDWESHPQQILADPDRDLLYVAVTNRDLVAVFDTGTDAVERIIDLRVAEGQLGVSPVALARSPDGCTLYVACANENAVVSVALEPRPDGMTHAYEVIGKIPTADYTTDVEVTPDGDRLIWLAGKGMGSTRPASLPEPFEKRSWQKGIVGILETPDDSFFRSSADVVAQNLQHVPYEVPVSTPVHGPDGGPSLQIDHVFLVVRENRTYDQIFGSIVGRGDGDPTIQLYEDNCGPENTAFEGLDREHPGCGITPNYHKLSREFTLLTRVFANAEASIDGHVFTSGGWVTDYAQRTIHQESRGDRPYDMGAFPISFPPRYFLFDQLFLAGISFRVYGERSGGLNLEGRLLDRRPYARQLQRFVHPFYPINGFGGCPAADEANDPAEDGFAGCFFDAGRLGFCREEEPACDRPANVPPPVLFSRMEMFADEFERMVRENRWPRFAYVLLFNNHGTSSRMNEISKASAAADNDLAVGQLVDLVSHSSLWPRSAIFIMEDDSQSGADHMDAHRMPAMVISPWAKRGGQVIDTRYDQFSIIRTVQLMLGLEPSSLFHALAVPLYDVFVDPAEQGPDLTPYELVFPERDLLIQNGPSQAAAGLQHLGSHMPFHETDLVPQPISDRLHYAELYGDDAHYPGPGPNASLVEMHRAGAARQLYAQGASAAEIEAFLERTEPGE